MKWDRFAALLLLLPCTCFALDEGETQTASGPARLDLNYYGRRAYAGYPSTSAALRTAPGGWRKVNDPAHPGESILINPDKSFSTPVHVNDADMGLVQAAAIATTIALVSERPVLDAVRSQRGKTADRLASFGEKFGSNIPALILSGGYVYGLLARDDGTKELTKLGLEASLATYIANSTLKHTFNRALPGDSRDPFASAKRGGTPARAFPSTHASEAFSIATWIAEASKTRGGDPMIPVLAYGAATITAWERLYDNQHWASDVIAGALLGHLVTKAVMAQDKPGRSLEFVPYISGRSTGIMVSYRGKGDGREPCGRGLQGLTRVDACISEAVNGGRRSSRSQGDVIEPFPMVASVSFKPETSPASRTQIDVYGREVESAN